MGTLGYHFLVGTDWDDSFHCACLVLGNHDVAIHPESAVGKVFAGLYVMYGGLCSYQWSQYSLLQFCIQASCIRFISMRTITTCEMEKGTRWKR